MEIKIRRISISIEKGINAQGSTIERYCGLITCFRGPATGKYKKSLIPIPYHKDSRVSKLEVHVKGVCPVKLRGICILVIVSAGNEAI